MKLRRTKKLCHFWATLYIIRVSFRFKGQPPPFIPKNRFLRAPPANGERFRVFLTIDKDIITKLDGKIKQDKSYKTVYNYRGQKERGLAHATYFWIFWTPLRNGYSYELKFKFGALRPTIQTSSAVSYRREMALHGGLFLAKSGRRYSADLQPLWCKRPAKLSNSVK